MHCLGSKHQPKLDLPVPSLLYSIQSKVYACLHSIVMTSLTRELRELSLMLRQSGSCGKTRCCSLIPW